MKLLIAYKKIFYIIFFVFTLFLLSQHCFAVLPSNSENFLMLAPENAITIASADNKSVGADLAPAHSEPVHGVSSQNGFQLSNFSIAYKAGIYLPQGEDMEVSYIGGFDWIWHINNIVNLRFGVEYSNPNVRHGSDLRVFKIPLVFIENEKKPELWGFKKAFYTGLGIVYIKAKYKDMEKQGIGGLFVIGRNFGKGFLVEAKFDALRKDDGYQFGGISTYLNYIY